MNLPSIRIPAEDLVPSLTLQGINSNIQNMNNKPQSHDSRRKTYRNEEMEGTPEKEGSECSMSYSPSNPTRTNTLSHRANSRNFPGRKGPQASHGSIDFPKGRVKRIFSWCKLTPLIRIIRWKIKFIS